MKESNDKNYTDITEIAQALGFRKHDSKPGFFFYPNCDLQIDLTASGVNERDVLVNTLRQVISFHTRIVVKNTDFAEQDIFRNGK